MANDTRPAAASQPVILPRSKAFEKINRAARQMLQDPKRDPGPLLALLGRPVDDFVTSDLKVVSSKEGLGAHPGYVTSSNKKYDDGTEVLTQEYFDGREVPITVAVNAFGGWGEPSGKISATPDGVYDISLEGPSIIENGLLKDYSPDVVNVSQGKSGSPQVTAYGALSPFPNGAPAIWTDGEWTASGTK